MVKKAAPYIIFVLCAVLMVIVRVGVGAGSEYKAGAAALAQKEYNSAIHHFDRAIHWYLPGMPAIDKSIDGLSRIADHYAQAKDVEGELYTWRILRSALYSVRHVRQPHKDVIAVCDEKIARLMAGKKGTPGTEAFEAEREKRLEQLSKKIGPKTGYALLAEAGFFGWVVSALLFIWLGVRPDRGFYGKRAIGFTLLFIVSYLVWIVGLSLA